MMLSKRKKKPQILNPKKKNKPLLYRMEAAMAWIIFSFYALECELQTKEL